MEKELEKLEECNMNEEILSEETLMTWCNTTATEDFINQQIKRFKIFMKYIETRYEVTLASDREKLAKIRYEGEWSGMTQGEVTVRFENWLKEIEERFPL